MSDKMDTPTQTTARQRLVDEGYEDVVIFENPSYDSALIGVTTDERAVYDYDLMVKGLVEQEGMDEFEAMERIDYNTIRACSYYQDAPIIMFRLLEQPTEEMK